MPTTYNDQFYTFDPANPPPAGASVNFVRYDLVDQNDDGDIDRFNADSVNGSDVVNSWPGDTVTVNVAGSGNVTYTGITFYLANGDRVFTPTDGQVLQNGTFVSSTFVNSQGPLPVGDLGPVCFTPGTLIETPGGRVAIETLAPGDLVLTRDGGPQPLRDIFFARFEARGRHAPVRFAPGALGNDGVLEVSQQHRMLLTGWRAELLFGEEEVLAPARHLLNGDTIRLRETGMVTYIHLLFDRHEIVTAGGIPSESYYPGHPGALAAAREARAFFPEAGSAPGAARRVLRAHEASLAVA